MEAFGPSYEHVSKDQLMINLINSSKKQKCSRSIYLEKSGLIPDKWALGEVMLGELSSFLWWPLAGGTG